MNALILSDYVPREWSDRAQARAALAEARERQAYRDADAAWAATRHAFFVTISPLDTAALRTMLAGHLSARLMPPKMAAIVAERLSRVELLDALADIGVFLATESL